ncbi:MAG: acyltransferase family protein [Deltaproteobacteria bacterium]|nr:acyltransferase family protein [Deltaproteobacteria bacterium]
MGKALSRLQRIGQDLVIPDLEDRMRRLPHRAGEFGVDEFGFDPKVARQAVLAAAWIYRYWFRAEAHGVARVPPGRVLLIANHSGQVPIDGLIIGIALFLEAEPPRLVRAMVERWAQTLPFVSEFFVRCGQVLGVPENCRRLLENEEAILVFPEGARGISKTIDSAYKLTEFGLGFMRLALETRTPIVPIAVVGGEEQYVSVADVKPLARLLGMPAFPIVPQMLIPIVGMLPLPVKYHVYFGEPMTFTGDPDDEDSVIEEKVWVVKSTIQSMINRGLKERRGLFR